MLARLTVTAAHVLDVQIEQCGMSAQNEDGQHSLVVDLDALRALVPQLPNNAWRRVAQACTRAVTPMCTNLHHTISSDFDNVAQLLLDLEIRHDNTLNSALPVGLLNPLTPSENVGIETRCLADPTPRPPAKRRRSSHSTMPIVIPSTHPSVPTIVITLSPPQPREMSCRIPYQDQAFGNLLTVPSHPVFNKHHPPMVLDPCSLPQLNEWKWENGHWEAVLPSLTEQTKRGMFSRPVMAKKKSSRSPRSNTKPAVQAM
ncbi:hypothetical protein BDZ97DRAFT_1919460 [Flammula alnicola]|nr:hypothetical protein BDZ97DRAFT_1919460 [Flammula alnicola]